MGSIGDTYQQISTDVGFAWCVLMPAGESNGSSLSTGAKVPVVHRGDVAVPLEGCDRDLPIPVCWPRKSDGSRSPDSGSFAAGGATRTRVRDRSRAAGKRAHSIGAKLRSRSAAGREEALAAVRRTTFGAGRPGRDRRHRCRTAAGQRETSAAPGTRQGHSPEGPRRARRGRGTPAGMPGPRHRRPRGPGHRDPADHRADPTAAGRVDTGRSDPAGQPARPRCSARSQGTAR